MQALDINADLTLIKDGVDFVQTFKQCSSVSEGYVQTVEVDPEGVTVDLSNFTTVDSIIIYNRDPNTLVHGHYTQVQGSYSYGDATVFLFNNVIQVQIVIGVVFYDFRDDNWRAGNYVVVQNSPSFDGRYLVTDVATLGRDLVTPTTFTGGENAVGITLDQHVKNRVPVGPQQFHLVSGSTLYLPDELTLSTPAYKPTATCEVWVFGS